MPVRPPRGADSGIPAVRSAIRELVATPGFLRQILGTIQLGRPAVTTPHTIYNLGLDAMAEGRGLDRAVHTATGYIVLEDRRIVAAAEVAVDERGTPTEFSSFTRGTELNGTERVLRSLDELPGVADREFELRLLRIPALYVRAIWLKVLQGDDDRLVPVSAPEDIRVGQPVPAARFLESMVDRAREILSFGDDVES